jgi:hypothetical protein
LLLWSRVPARRSRLRWRTCMARRICNWFHPAGSAVRHRQYPPSGHRAAVTDCGALRRIVRAGAHGRLVEHSPEHADYRVTGHSVSVAGMATHLEGGGARHAETVAARWTRTTGGCGVGAGMDVVAPCDKLVAVGAAWCVVWHNVGTGVLPSGAVCANQGQWNVSVVIVTSQKLTVSGACDYVFTWCHDKEMSLN